MSGAAARLIAVAVAATGCARASEDSAARVAPNTPPPAVVAIPADLHIAVEGAGASTVIDHAALAALAPDFADADRRAWRLSRLVPAFDQAGETLEARGASGPAVMLDFAASATAPVPVLVLTRRGELVASVVDPQQPFPAYHGQGGRLGRSGSETPRLVGVKVFKLIAAGVPAQ
jgi:hypothetical protein